jgi:hypothetical protein
MSAEQEAADAAERERMRALAAELQEFNRLRQMQLSDRERRERWGLGNASMLWACGLHQHVNHGSG